MSTKIYKTEYSTKNASHSVIHPVHGAYGHNRDISDTVLPNGSSATVFVHSALCLSACVYAQAGELKFH